MIDLVYILGTIGFFVLMLLYVRACERLGRVAPSDAGQSDDVRS